MTLRLKKFSQLLIGAVMLVSVLLNSSCKTSKSTQHTTTKPVTTVPPTPKPPVEPPKEVKKDEVRKIKIALIMPFELEENFKTTTDESPELEIDPASLEALNFYEGAMLAVDSLKKLNTEITINSYDAPSDSSGIVRVIRNPFLKEADLVIATFPNNLVPVAAAQAKISGIKILLTQAGTPAVLDQNPNAALAYASTITQCREMAGYMLDIHPDANIILVYRTVKREDELAAIFRNEIQRLKGAREFKELNATDKGNKDLVGMLSKSKRNVIFIVSSDEAFINPLLGQLEEQDIFGLMVAGLPTWQNFESIDFMAFKNVQVHIFDNDFVNTESEPEVSLRKLFINTYHNYPQSSAFKGFEIVYKLGSSSGLKEKELSKTIRDAFRQHDSSYHFEEVQPGSGVENKAISVLKFNDYKLEKVNH